MTTTVDVDADRSGASVAAALTAAVARARQAGRAPLIGWPVGRTTEPVARALSRADLQGVEFVLMDDFVDESHSTLRRIEMAHPCSCRAAALRDLPVPADRVWSPDPEQPETYDRRIADAGGIEVFVVAFGATDGHVALNPPGTAPDTRTRVIDIAQSTRRDNAATFRLTRPDEVPARGVTVGLATIRAARTILVVAHGDAKRDMARRLLAADAFDPAVPATALLGHPDLHLFCDRAATGVS